MSLFGLSDIQIIKDPGPERSGPLGPLNRSEFERSTLRYPIDLGAADKAHYVVFYVRAQKATRYTTYKGMNLDESLLLSENDRSMYSGYMFPGGVAPPVPGGTTEVKPIKRKSPFPSTTGLTTDAIALYMPDTLMYSQHQSYDQLSIGSEPVGQIAAAAKSAVDALRQGGDLYTAKEQADAAVIKSGGLLLGRAIAGGAGGLLGSPQSGRLAFTAFTGVVLNPMLELIYRSPQFRSFQFDFMFYPRSEKEALEAQNIIERFKFHNAPELVKGAEGFLVPPSEFDIKFYYGGNQNPNIPPLATCVLVGIDVNYAPNGWSAYEVPGANSPSLGGTGMPVAIQMTLQFQETTYLTKEDFRSDVVGSSTLAMGTTSPFNEKPTV